MAGPAGRHPDLIDILHIREAQDSSVFGIIKELRQGGGFVGALWRRTLYDTGIDPEVVEREGGGNRIGAVESAGED